MQLGRTTALLALALTVAACSGTADAPGDGTTVSPTTLANGPTTTETPTTVAPDQPILGNGAVFDWTDPAKTADLGDGWIVAACEGDAPLLCVEREGELVGVVEAQTFPTATLDMFDPDAAAEANLLALAADFIEVFEEDRAIGCGADYRINPVPADPFVLGNSPGIVYGFEGRLGDGTQSELNLHYATILGEDVVTINASAYDEGGCPGRDDLGGFDSTTLIEFRPYLEAVLHESPLPELR